MSTPGRMGRDAENVQRAIAALSQCTHPQTGATLAAIYGVDLDALKALAAPPAPAGVACDAATALQKAVDALTRYSCGTGGCGDPECCGSYGEMEIDKDGDWVRLADVREAIAMQSAARAADTGARE